MASRASAAMASEYKGYARPEMYDGWLVLQEKVLECAMDDYKRMVRSGSFNICGESIQSTLDYILGIAYAVARKEDVDAMFHKIHKKAPNIRLQKSYEDIYNARSKAICPSDRSGS